MPVQVPPSRRIADELLSWPGIEAGPHRLGGVEFRVDRRQLGHLHGDEIADLPLRPALRDELIAAGEHANTGGDATRDGSPSRSTPKRALT